MNTGVGAITVLKQPRIDDVFGAELLRCPVCKGIIAANASFCSHCGNSMRGAKGKGRGKSEREEKRHGKKDKKEKKKKTEEPETGDYE